MAVDAVHLLVSYEICSIETAADDVNTSVNDCTAYAASPQTGICTVSPTNTDRSGKIIWTSFCWRLTTALIPKTFLSLRTTWSTNCSG